MLADSQRSCYVHQRMNTYRETVLTLRSAERKLQVRRRPERGANQVLRNRCSQRACPASGLGGDRCGLSPRHLSWLPKAESLAAQPSPCPRALPRIRVTLWALATPPLIPP